MQLGLYLMTQYPLDAPLDGAVADLAAQVRVAGDSGFASVWLPQHFATEGLQMLQLMPLMGRLAAEAEGLTFGSAIMLYAMLNPAVVAEETATLDWITGGSFILGIGLGYRREEFEVTGVPFDRRAGRYEEAIGLLRRLWREERVSHRGDHFTVDGRRASLRPKQAGGPPLWMGGEAPAAIERAARMGDAWMAAPAPRRDLLQTQLARFRAARAAAGLPLPETQPLTRECCIGASRADALAVARGPLLLKYRTYAAWGQADSAGRQLEEDFDGFMADRFIVGDAAEVADEIARYREELGIDHLILRVQWPGLEQAAAVGAIRRLGRIAAKLT